MLIQVRYSDNSYGMVDESRLDKLIFTNEIVEFRRSSGWVRIGRDPVRGQRLERRRKGSMINIYV